MDKLVPLALELGFTKAAALNVSALRPMEEVRQMCAADRCRAYGKSWSCPPACGSLERCAERLRGFDGGVLVQTLGRTEGDFDEQAIRETERLHRERFFELARLGRGLCPGSLALGAGPCGLCLKCAYPRPCRFPQKMIPSMEAYGLLVSQVCRDSGLDYYYGAGTISFTACILTKEGNETP